MMMIMMILKKNVQIRKQVNIWCGDIDDDDDDDDNNIKVNLQMPISQKLQKLLYEEGTMYLHHVDKFMCRNICEIALMKIRPYALSRFC